MYQIVILNGVPVAEHEMHQDIRGLYPGAEIVVMDRPIPLGEDGDWVLEDPRTDEEKKEMYRSKRRLEYPSIEEQLDMLYHDTINHTNTWTNAITTVKERHPKPATK